MSIPGISSSSQNYSSGSSGAGSGTKPGGGSSNDDLIAKAEAVARESFEMTLRARQITNKYAAAKEVR